MSELLIDEAQFYKVIDGQLALPSHLTAAQAQRLRSRRQQDLKERKTKNESKFQLLLKTPQGTDWTRKHGLVFDEHAHRWEKPSDTPNVELSLGPIYVDDNGHPSPSFKLRPTWWQEGEHEEDENIGTVDDIQEGSLTYYHGRIDHGFGIASKASGELVISPLTRPRASENLLGPTEDTEFEQTWDPEKQILNVLNIAGYLKTAANINENPITSEEYAQLQQFQETWKYERTFLHSQRPEFVQFIGSNWADLESIKTTETLRNNGRLTGYQVKLLQSVEDNLRPLEEDATVWRGSFDSRSFTIGQNWALKAPESTSYNISIPTRFIQRAIGEKENPDWEIPPNEIVEDDAPRRPVLFKMNVPRGTSTLTYLEQLEEVVLPIGTQIEVIDISSMTLQEVDHELVTLQVSERG